MRLHLERLPSDAVIEHRRITDRDELGQLYCAYRATPWRVERPMWDPLARPLRLQDVAGRMEEFSPDNRRHFLSLVDQFKAVSGPVKLRLPAYRLVGGEALLLDGNHRATALWMSGKAIDVTLATLCAPVDRRVLIDLKYWDGGWRRFLNRIRRGTIADRVRRAIRLP
ncbi:hypothetical protein [Devosia geojensis]|uniref:hypothetical protein n=1 Tax=Devosia geojensis TaxID=443610 RepID=UPI00128E072D|nr:hypothetical protein [Devosia geojensis]